MTLIPGVIDSTTNVIERDQMVVIVQGLNDHLSLVGDLPKPAVDVAKYNLE
jgi:hypothetical protein